MCCWWLPLSLLSGPELHGPPLRPLKNLNRIAVNPPLPTGGLRSSAGPPIRTTSMPPPVRWGTSRIRTPRLADPGPNSPSVASPKRRRSSFGERPWRTLRFTMSCITLRSRRGSRPIFRTGLRSRSRRSSGKILAYPSSLWVSGQGPCSLVLQFVEMTCSKNYVYLVFSEMLLVLFCDVNDNLVCLYHWFWSPDLPLALIFVCLKKTKKEKKN